MREVVGGWVGGTTLLPSSMKSVRLQVLYALQTASKPTARKAETSVWVWGRLRLPFSRPWRFLCLLVPVAASLEGHQKPALPLQLLLLLGYRRGQSIATANKACRPLKSAQCQLSQSERVKYGYWKLHWAAPGLIFHLMFACNMVQYWTAVL